MKKKIKLDLQSDQITEKIKNEFGIDISKYRNEEIVGNLLDLILFPKYAISWIIRPVGIALLLYFLGFFIIDLVHIEYLLYFIFGLVLFLATGLVTGLLVLTFKLKQDISEILSFTFDLLKSSMKDINTVKDSISLDKRKQVLGTVFQGIIHGVILPTLSDVISKKIPLVGGILTGIITKILTLITQRIDFDEKEFEKELAEEVSESSFLEKVEFHISNASDDVESVISITTKIIEAPIKVVFFILVLLLGLFLYVIW